MNTDDRQQHIDTLARAINAPAFVEDDRFPGAMRAMSRDAARRDAEAIFDSTDPAVHDALTAALHANADRARVLAAHADAGWLDTERCIYDDPWHYPIPSTQDAIEKALAQLPGAEVLRRLATRWEPLP